MTTNWKRWLEKGRELFCALLFPARCPVCDEILAPEEMKQGIHSACERRLYPILGAVCMHCGRPLGYDNPREKETKYRSTREYCYDCVAKKYDRLSYITQAKALYVYKGDIKTTMYRFKYSNKREYSEYLARRGLEQQGAWLRRTGAEAIIPVPLYKGKKRKRGYNQAECFARTLSKRCDIPIDTELVVRGKDTAPLKLLSEAERKNSLKNAFQIGKSVVQYKRVIVVDDIYTTGSTAEAVARELKKYGVSQVYLLTVCIGEDR